jgi:stage V sporulation protein B
MYNQSNIGVMLKMMAPVALFIYFQAPLQATLQALNKPGTALVNTLIGSSVKLLLIYWLASKPEMGILGAIMAINVNIVLITFLHWNSVVRLLKFHMQGTEFLKIGTAMAVSGMFSYIIMYTHWSEGTFLRFCTSCITGITLYIMMILLLRIIDHADLQRVKSYLFRFRKI